MNRTKQLFLLSATLLACHTQTLPTGPLTASAISLASCAATVRGCVALLDEAARQEARYGYPHFTYGNAYFFNTMLMTFGCFIVPAIAFGCTSKARMLSAKFALREISKKEIVQQDPQDRIGFYDFIAKAYADRSWPLMGAKDELKQYFVELDSVKKEFKKVVLEVKKRGKNWPEGANVMVQLEKLKAHVADLLVLINEHPDYARLVKEYEEKRSMNDLATAQTLQACALVAQC